MAISTACRIALRPGPHCGLGICGKLQPEMSIDRLDNPQRIAADIGLPDVDGYELLRRIRERPSDRNGTVPAAALTAYARVADRTRSLQGGFQMHIGKPVQPIELVAAIRWLADAAKGT